MIARFIALALILLTQAAFALELELTQGVYAPHPIGINAFGGIGQGRTIQEVIENDLRLSGQFKTIDSSRFNAHEQPTIRQWRQAGADSVVSGRVTRAGRQFDVNVELFDAAAKGRLLFAKNYQVDADELRSLAHHISDEIYEKLTGERGVFSTRVAYILVQRQAKKTKYSLEVADMDGHHPQSLLVSFEPIMSPSWSPDAQQIAYVSFENKRPQIYIVSVATGKRRLVTNFGGINGAPAWSPDGKHLAVVLSKNGSPNLYSIDLASGALKQLTFGKSIDTEPSYSPDGRYLLFTSGRGGAPQIYRLSLSDGQIERLTFEGNYNARASYTPNQKQIVLLHRQDKTFNIGVQNAQTGRIFQLTHAAMDESPAVSPNGRLIIYATQEDHRGVLGVVSIDGRIRMKLPSRDGDIQEPIWSPYWG